MPYSDRHQVLVIIIYIPVQLQTREWLRTCVDVIARVSLKSGLSLSSLLLPTNVHHFHRRTCFGNTQVGEVIVFILLCQRFRLVFCFSSAYRIAVYCKSALICSNNSTRLITEQLSKSSYLTNQFSFSRLAVIILVMSSSLNDPYPSEKRGRNSPSYIDSADAQTDHGEKKMKKRSPSGERGHGLSNNWDGKMSVNEEKNAWSDIASATAQSTFPEWFNVAAMISLIFGGCCANVSLLSYRLFLLRI